MSKLLGNVFPVAATLLVSVPAFAQQPQQLTYRPHMWTEGWFGWFAGPIMMIVFIALVVVVIVFLVRWLGGTAHFHAPPGPPSKTPLDILRERFARGEIDKEEFEERRRVLGD